MMVQTHYCTSVLIVLIIAWPGAFSIVTVTTDAQVNISTVGERAILSCQYTFDNPADLADIKWYKVDSANPIFSKYSTLPTGTPGPGYSNKLSSNGSSITFLFTNATDAGTYNCTVENYNTGEKNTSQVYMMIQVDPDSIYVQRKDSGDLEKDGILQLFVSSTNARPLVKHSCEIAGEQLSGSQPSYNLSSPAYDPLYGSTVTQFDIKVKTNYDGEQVVCCVTGSRICSNFTFPGIKSGHGCGEIHHYENTVSPDTEKRKKKKKKKELQPEVQRVAVPRKLPPLPK